MRSARLPVKSPVRYRKASAARRRQRAAQSHEQRRSDSQPGILPDHMIAALAKAGGIVAARAVRRRPDPAGQPRPAARRQGAYRVRASFLPGPRTTVAERIDDLKLHEIALTDGAVLETNCVYIVPLLESLALPADVAAAANPKSSTGRLDVFTRVIADRTRGFDRIGAGYHGPLYAEISPKTFPGAGARRLAAVADPLPPRPCAARRADAARAARARAPHRRRRGRRRRRHRGRRRSRRAWARTNLVGYRAKRHTGVIDVEQRDGYDARRFLGADRGARRQEPDPRSGRVLHPRLEGSRAGAARLRRRDGAVRSAGRRIPRPLRRLLRSGLRLRGRRRPRRARGARGALARGAVHPGARPDRRPPGLREDGLRGRTTLYGQGIGSNYQAQGLKLSKHFRV